MFVNSVEPCTVIAAVTVNLISRVLKQYELLLPCNRPIVLTGNSSVYLILLDLTLSSAIVWAFTESAYKDAINAFASSIRIEQRISYTEQLVLIKMLLYLPQVL